MISNYNEVKQYILLNQRVVAKGYAIINACMQKVQLLDVLPVSDRDYEKCQKSANKILSKIQGSCESLERINIMTRVDYSFDIVMDKTRIKTMAEEVVRQSSNFFAITRDYLKDGYILDRQLDDLEQLHFLLCKFTLLIAENYKICINRIDENIKDLTDDQQK